MKRNRILMGEEIIGGGGGGGVSPIIKPMISDMKSEHSEDLKFHLSHYLQQPSHLRLQFFPNRCCIMAIILASNIDILFHCPTNHKR